MTLQDFDIRFCIYGDWQYSDSGVVVVSNIIVYKDIAKLNMEMDASWINISQDSIKGEIYFTEHGSAAILLVFD